MNRNKKLKSSNNSNRLLTGGRGCCKPTLELNSIKQLAPLNDISSGPLYMYINKEEVNNND